MTSTDPTSFRTESDEKDDRRTNLSSRPRPTNFGSSKSAFESLALDVSFSGLASTSTPNASRTSRTSFESRESEERDPELWEDIGVVEYLERGLSPGDDSTPEDREETLRQVLSETDIHEGDGDLSDFLFHVARTKHGRIYIRVIRTLLLNRGRLPVSLVRSNYDPQ